MDKYKRQARYAAWFDDPDEQAPIKNPFRKYRASSGSTQPPVRDELSEIDGEGDVRGNSTLSNIVADSPKDHGSRLFNQLVLPEVDRNHHAPRTKDHVGKYKLIEHMDEHELGLSHGSILQLSLDLDIGHSLKTLAEEARQESTMMRRLTEKATDNAAAVKVLTLITLMYLPANTTEFLLHGHWRTRATSALRQLWVGGNVLDSQKEKEGADCVPPQDPPKYSNDGGQGDSGEPNGQWGLSFTAIGRFRAAVLDSWINILLIMFPVGIAAHYAHVNPVIVFVINFIALIPLTSILSCATETIALRTGEVIGGLLNAAAGDVLEFIVSMNALLRHQMGLSNWTNIVSTVVIAPVAVMVWIMVLLVITPAARLAKVLQSSRIHAAVLRPIRQRPCGFALLTVLRFLPITHGATIEHDHLQRRVSPGTQLKPVGLLLLIVLIGICIAALVRVLVWGILQEGARRMDLQGKAKKINDAFYQAFVSLMFCAVAVYMFKFYFDPRSSNEVTWIILGIFTSETLAFHHYHYVLHNESSFGHKMVPILVGVVLTMILGVANFFVYGPFAFWLSVAICPWLCRLGNESQERAYRELEEGRASAHDGTRGPARTRQVDAVLTERRAQSVRRHPPSELDTAFAIGSDSEGSANENVSSIARSNTT